MVNKNIFLIGFMGSGKSTIARLLAKETHKELIEMDETIEAEEGCSINQIFKTQGEIYFRDVESRLVMRIAEKGDAVVSCGGGTVLREENVLKMRENGIIVYLSATPETIYRRVRYSTHRPLLNGNMNVEYITQLMEKRLPMYESAADLVIDVNDKEKSDIVFEILQRGNNVG